MRETRIPDDGGDGVYGSITKLCETIVNRRNSSGITDESIHFSRPIIKKLRSKAYEIILKKSSTIKTRERSDPVLDLLSSYFTRTVSRNNIIDYYDTARLKDIIDWIFESKIEENDPYFLEVLRLVVALQNTTPNDSGKHLYENPFTFGKLDDILPSIASVNKNDPKPYHHFPPEIFFLPFNICNDSKTIQDREFFQYAYSNDLFVSKPGTKLKYLGKLPSTDYQTSITNGASLASSVYSTSLEIFGSYPRLVSPRQLNIPCEKNVMTMKFSSTCDTQYVNNNLHNMVESGPAATLWELASKEIDTKLNIWEEAAKLPIVEKRCLMSSSLSGTVTWRQIISKKIDKLTVTSESQFILHLKHLLIGMESSAFIYDKTLQKFIVKKDLCIEGLLCVNFVSDLLKTGTCYRKLDSFITSSVGDKNVQNGIIYKAMCNSLQQYLEWYGLEINKVFGEGLITIEHETKRLPTLLEIMHNIKPLSVQIQTIAWIYRIFENGSVNKLCGSGLMAYLYNEIILTTNIKISPILYSILQTTCSVYFRFIQRFIFEGEIDDNRDDFFIKKNLQYVNSYNKRYWNKGFIIKDIVLIPEFLRNMARYILLCGKSLRLLKMCNPDDPLCVMLSSDYPPIKCCLTFDEVESQQILYDNYKVQCLYVCGEPITFQSLLIQKDAEKRAFYEMVALKQAENLEKLIEERKRLSRALQINKRKQFAALREAAENAIIRKREEKENDIAQEKLINENIKIADEIHQSKLEEEKKRVLAFYDEIEKEVIKRQLMAEWKIKRLKLDQNRVQLLMTEKLNFERERLELEHKTDQYKDYYFNKNKINYILDTECNEDYLNLDIQVHNPSFQNTPLVDEKKNTKYMQENKDTNSENSINNNFSVQPICNEYISKHLNMGNEIVDINKNISGSSSNNLQTSDSADIINRNNVSRNVEDSSTNLYNMYTTQKIEALKNKQKVMSHEFGVTKNEDNAEETSDLPDDNQNLKTPLRDLNEAKRNRMKILGSNINNNNFVSDHNRNEITQYCTDASKEALRNKQKVLGHEFGIDTSYDDRPHNLKLREKLTLDLQDCNKHVSSSRGKERNEKMYIKNTPDIVLNNYIDTPGDYSVPLDIETPSTFVVGPFGLPSSNMLSPLSAQLNENFENSSNALEEFPFPNIYEDYNCDEEISDDFVDNGGTSLGINNIPSLENDYKISSNIVKSSVWNFTTDDLNFDDFKPFGMTSTINNKFTSMDIFARKFSLDNDNSPYANIKNIIKKSNEKPMSSIFEMSCEEDKRDMLQKIDNADLSIIATCLQRSIMIPLLCQMEMVNNATLKYFLVNCDLYEHLKNIRNYFFMMDGEFAKIFCMNLFDKLHSTESPKELLNFATLHHILNKSCGSSVYGVNKYSDNLSFIVNDVPFSFHHSSPDILDCLTLSYNVNWPLNIILSQEAMDRYAKIFQFLVKLRRISWVLEHDSEVLKISLKEEFMVSKELLHSPQYHSIQLYRYIMSTLITALHSYIFTTCLQSSWLEFEKDLANARTLDDLYSFHVIYVKKVLFRCLLNNRSAPIMKVLNDIFCVVLKFHHLLNARCWHIAEDEIHYTHPYFSDMRILFMTFEKLAKYFYKIIIKLTNNGYQPHLVELLSIISMNDYYKSLNK